MALRSETNLSISAAVGFRNFPVALSTVIARVALYLPLPSAASAVPALSESASAQLAMPNIACRMMSSTGYFHLQRG